MTRKVGVGEGDVARTLGRGKQAGLDVDEHHRAAVADGVGQERRGALPRRLELVRFPRCRHQGVGGIDRHDLALEPPTQFVVGRRDAVDRRMVPELGSSRRDEQHHCVVRGTGCLTFGYRDDRTAVHPDA
ncbi:MAG: hypothetical protein ITG02_10870 [Patulibacter sp.]|nr:hypothetical protein [Patulibacter sp.]